MEIKIVDWNIEPLHVIDGGIFQEKCFIAWKESRHIAIIISYVDEWHLEKTKEGKERKKKLTTWTDLNSVSFLIRNVSPLLLLAQLVE